MADRATVLVTGGGGFIGRALVARLIADGVRVRALVRYRSVRSMPWHEEVVAPLENPLPRDLCDGVERVFHLAGIAHAIGDRAVTKEIYRRVNRDATIELARLAAAAGVKRFVFFSSVKAVSHPGDRVIDESWTESPPTADHYGISKREAESGLAAALSGSDTEWTILRPVLVYGPGVKGNLERMLHAVARRRFPPLPPSTGLRSMVALDDLVAAAILASCHEKAASKVYIVSDRERYEVAEIHSAMARLFGDDAPRWSLPAWLLRLLGWSGDLAGNLTGRSWPVNSEVIGRLIGSAGYDGQLIGRELGFRPEKRLWGELPAIAAAAGLDRAGKQI